MTTRQKTMTISKATGVLCTSFSTEQAALKNIEAPQLGELSATAQVLQGTASGRLLGHGKGHLRCLELTGFLLQSMKPIWPLGYVGMVQ